MQREDTSGKKQYKRIRCIQVYNEKVLAVQKAMRKDMNGST